MPGLEDPVPIGRRTAPSRVLFGPHETNLARGREISDRHVAYYARRAAGGAGVVVVEAASVHDSDWPYERAPRAVECEPGWTAVADACRPHGTLVLAGLGHAGGQGSSAYSQAVLWAPSGVADAISREPPAAVEPDEVAAVVAGFAAAAAGARRAALDGVEIDAGPQSLLRQFHSGLTNLRGDGYGEDRLRFTREVLAAVRARLGDGILALRLSCDELAPWAGVTPEHAAEHVAALAPLVDLLTVVRGGPFSVTAYRPDAHTPPAFNRDLCAAMREVAGGVPVVLQGSVVEPAGAQAALADGVCDLVEMTRAQIAEPRLVALLRGGGRPRPCVLCNQACRVRDPRNPIVSCVGEPASGHELEGEIVDAAPAARAPVAQLAGTRPPVLVVGGGPAGLECARVLALRGRTVRLAERGDRLGGALRVAAVGVGRERLARLTDWLEAECRDLGVEIALDTEVRELAGDAVLATGSRPARSGLDALTLLASGVAPEGPVIVHDPVGGPVGVGVAEWLAAQGLEVALVTQDAVAGTQLAVSGDLADANGRLQRAGVRRELRALLRAHEDGRAVLEDVHTGERRAIPCATLVDCGHRLPEEALYRPGVPRAGDCVAPRTVLEAVLEGRRRALELAA